MQSTSRFFRTLTCTLILSASAWGADEKITEEKAKDLLNKVIGEVSKNASKIEEKPKGLWEKSKETFKLSREDYMKKVESALLTMDAEVQGIQESESSILTRDYFKMRLDSIKLQIEYCKRNLDRLKELPTEEAFRVKQKGYDRTLSGLSDLIELTKQEAGV
ncbi:hypothetical protein BH11VER1_BH11VER1_24840 [soil metagenome]